MAQLSPGGAKEAFYKDLTGTTPAEVALVVAVGPASELLRFTLVPVLVLVFGSVTKTLWFKLSVDFITLVLPLLFAFTIWSDHLRNFLVALVVASATLLFVAYILHPIKYQGATRRPSKARQRQLWELPMESDRPLFMTMFRVHGMVASAIAILAVDFPVFPRRFGKTEVFGTGLMDVAVGAFVFMNAVVSKEARGLHCGIFSGCGLSRVAASLARTLISTLPLLFLGLIRLVAVKTSGYHEHVSEYGIHWNFFFTLAVVIIFSSVCLLIIPPALSGPLSLAIAIGYQYVLSNHGLGQYVLEGSDGKGGREGLLNANREGIVSCVGYVAIYFAGVWVGRFLLKRRRLFFDWWIIFLITNVVNVLLWIMVEVSRTYIEPVCRRTANLPFIVWTLSYCIQLLVSYMLVDIILTLGKEFIWKKPYKTKEKASSRHPLVPDSILVSSFSPNLLFIFILSNLLTGAVNLTVDTIVQPPAVSMTIVVGYMLVLCLVAMGLHLKGVRLKFG